MTKLYLRIIQSFRKQNYLSFLLIITTLSGLHVSAQQDSLSREKLQEIIIQNERIQIPYAKQNHDITVIDQAEIKVMPVNSINEVLSYVSGIDVRQRGVMGAQADVGINGGTFDQTLVLLNGIKIIDPQTGHLMMNLPVNLSVIKRIEILKGPAASAYGVNAINGAINIVTLQPKKTGVMAQVRSGSSFKRDSTSNHLYSGLHVDASASLSTKKLDQLFSLSTTQSNGYRHNSSIDNAKVFYINRIDIGENSQLKTTAGYVSNTFGANGFYSAPVDTESKEKVNTAIGAINGHIRLSDIWTMRPEISYRYNEDHYILDKHQPDLYQNKHYTNVFNAGLNNTFHTGMGRFGLGFEFRNDQINSNSLGEHSRNNFGIFVNYNLNLIPKTSINLGLYGNYNSDYGWDWSPSIDAGYQLSKPLRVYVSAGTGVRLPTFTDLYYEGPVNEGFEGLIPETSWQTEGGVKYERTRFSASASYFYRNTDDFIDWAKDSLDSPWQSRNYVNVKTQGFSLTADYTIVPASSANGTVLSTEFSYTYLNPKASQQSHGLNAYRYSHYAIDNLKHQLTGKVRVRFLHNFHFTLIGKYEKRVSYKEYALLAARLSADLNKFEIYADVDNLTDINYTEAGVVQMPGRWITLGLKWQWWR